MQINDIIEESVRFLKPESDKAKVKCELRRDTPAVPLDAGQMKQAFYNLIRNACQAMPKGGEITITGSFTDFKVRVSFQDTGKGITAEQMAKLFQPFSTMSPTGTGLLIVRRIIREHGGEVDIERHEGKGTRVSLLLPLVEKEVRLLEGGVVESQG